ncbi:MAG: hypothetical protein CMQ19_10240 [Gammaproteobacteria bacterium]|nr:hypothetical protein [Gammaproteobacteria bacterium]|tara:strand:+ start:1898 stop:2728 length:831 start_codon:yes stop_codon:yes gene_type:complete
MSKVTPVEDGSGTSKTRHILQAECLTGLGFWEWDILKERLIYCSESYAAMLDITVQERMEATASHTLDYHEGAGIPQHLHGKIFEPFFTTKETGSGLGLATCYTNLKKHGEHIYVTSRQGEGSKFDFYVPATIEVPSTKMDESKIELAQTACKILVMDDVDLIRMLDETMLTKLGCETITCSDGKEAVHLYEAAMKTGQPFDAVILDLTIPDSMGGKDTIEQLLEIDPRVRAIVASGYSDDSAIANAGKYGFSGVLNKPFRLEELTQVLNEVLRDN